MIKERSKFNNKPILLLIIQIILKFHCGFILKLYLLYFFLMFHHKQQTNKKRIQMKYHSHICLEIKRYTTNLIKKVQKNHKLYIITNCLIGFQCTPK